MEPESSSPYPQVPATRPYPEPTPSGPHDPLQSLKTYLTIECAFRTRFSLFRSVVPRSAWYKHCRLFFWFGEPVSNRCCIEIRELIQHKLVNFNRASRITGWHCCFISGRSRLEILRPTLLTRFYIKSVKVHPCTDTEALYRPYCPQGG